MVRKSHAHIITCHQIHAILPLEAVQQSLLLRKVLRQSENTANGYSTIHTCHHTGRLAYIHATPLIIEDIHTIRIDRGGQSSMRAVAG
jgi:hypothetical protein